VTEHQRLSATEDHYRLLFETAPEVVFVFEAEGEHVGRIVAASRCRRGARLLLDGFKTT
jgi:hypothetical protein